MAAPTQERKRHAKLSCTATASLSPPRPSRRASSSRDARPRRRRNTIPARATPRSRSATSIPTAARPRPTASSARPSSAYFKKVNAEGGINGRKINFISYDDGYSPPKAVEQARKLVESDEVLLIFQPLGTPSNTAIQKYMNVEEGAAALRRHRRDQMGRPEELPLDHGLAADLPVGGPDLRQVPAREAPERQDRHPLPERRLRQGLRQGPEGRARRQGEDDDRRRSALRDLRPDGRLADRATSRPPAPTCSSTSRRRNSPPRRSRRRPRSAGSRCTSSTTSRTRSARCCKPAGLENAKGILFELLPQGPDRSAVEGRRRR